MGPIIAPCQSCWACVGNVNLVWCGEPFISTNTLHIQLRPLPATENSGNWNMAMTVLQPQNLQKRGENQCVIHPLSIFHFLLECTTQIWASLGLILRLSYLMTALELSWGASIGAYHCVAAGQGGTHTPPAADVSLLVVPPLGFNPDLPNTLETRRGDNDTGNNRRGTRRRRRTTRRHHQ